MGLRKQIKKMIPKEEVSMNGLRNTMLDMADDCPEFENLLVEYAIDKIIRKDIKKAMDITKQRFGKQGL